MDRRPAHPKEAYQACFFGSEGWGYTLDAASSYKMVVEIFQFGEDARTINYLFHHDNRKPSTAYRLERLNPPTHDFDTRLTLFQDPNNQGRKSTYYTGPNLRKKARRGACRVQVVN